MNVDAMLQAYARNVAHEMRKNTTTNTPKNTPKKPKGLPNSRPTQPYLPCGTASPVFSVAKCVSLMPEALWWSSVAEAHYFLLFREFQFTYI